VILTMAGVLPVWDIDVESLSCSEFGDYAMRFLELGENLSGESDGARE